MRREHPPDFFAIKRPYPLVPSKVSPLGKARVLDLISPVVHQNGFIYLKNQQEDKQYHMYMQLLNVSPWYGSELEKLSAEARIAFVQCLELNHDEEHYGLKRKLVLSYNRSGPVTSVALYGDDLRNIEILFNIIRQLCLDYS